MTKSATLKRWLQSLTPHGILLGIFLACLLLSFILETIWIMLIPFVLLSLPFFLTKLSRIYYLMIFTIPLSIEWHFGPISLDTPDEIFNLFFFFLLPGFILLNYNKLDFSFVRHPVVVLLAFSYIISIITTITSVNTVLSIKYLLAKAWYIVAYFGFTLLFVSNSKSLLTLCKILTVSCLITICYVMFRHGLQGFSFDSINFTVGPFYSNHVNYAIQILLILPYLWLWYRHRQINHQSTTMIKALMVLFIVAIYFSYTRAAIGAVVLAIPFYYIIRWRLMKLSIIFGTLAVLSYGIYLVKDNRFFDYAPDYTKAISHQDFNKLLTATYNLEDVSTMERVYRWVAARYMVGANPLFGVGPNNFYDTYKSYTLKSFTTYVSDNKDNSTVHSYILLLCVEQGIIAALVFLALYFWIFLKGQNLYHRIEDPFTRSAVLASITSLFFLFVVLSINDLIESDKEGSMYYIWLAVLTGIHWRLHKKNITSQQT